MDARGPLDPRDEPLSKRRRLDEAGAASYPEIPKSSHPSHVENGAHRRATPLYEDESYKEARAGITTFITPDRPGFRGVLKQRHASRFIVKDGQVLHLKNLKPYQPIGKPHLSTTRTGVDEGRKLQGAAEAASAHNGDTAAQTMQVDDAADKRILEDLLGEEKAAQLMSFHEHVVQQIAAQKKVSRSLITGRISDKDARTRVHQEIRRIFKSSLETTTADDDTIVIKVAPKAGTARGGGTRSGGTEYKGKLGWEELGGEYLYFTLHKENKDTMEALGYLSSQLHTKPKTFQFAGTKDRRAATVQRCSAYRIRAEQLAALNPKLVRSQVGDFEYSPTGLELGDLGGNEFVITLRECRFEGDERVDPSERISFATEILTKSVNDFIACGFINYYGLQRFGTFSVPNDVVGMKLLQGRYGEAVADILTFSPLALTDPQALDGSYSISQDDKSRAEALNMWLTNQDSSGALQKLPRRFSAETNIIRHLGKRNQKTKKLDQQNDYQGALNTLPRNLRLMYVHAYQSLIWNKIANKRWGLSSTKVIKGDLVLVNDHVDKVKASSGPATVDEQGEPIVLPAKEDRAATTEDSFERARALTADEAIGGQYSIFDVVLPLPGYDVLYPANEIGEAYKTMMKSEEGGGIDPHDMRRSWRDVSLSGGYRKMLARPGPQMAFEVKSYVTAEEQLVLTDMDRIKLQSNTIDQSLAEHKDAGTAAPGPEASVTADEKIAVILKMRLGSSQYATMALRELMKHGGVESYKPEFRTTR